MRQRHRVIATAVIALYPPSWRGRYGREMHALVEETGLTRGAIVDLLGAALVAWVFPRSGRHGAERRRWRLEATLCTCAVAWAITLIGMAGFSRGIDDSPLPGLDSRLPNAAFHAAETSFTISAAVVALVVVFYGLVVFAPAVRRRAGSIVLPVALPSAAALSWTAASIGMGWLIPRLIGSHGPIDRRIVIGLGFALLAWAAAGGLILMACAVGGGMALRRSHLSEQLLIPGAVGGAVVAACALVSSGCAVVCLVSLLESGRTAPGDLVMPGIGAALVLAGATVAITAAGRGATAVVGALRRM